MRSSTSAVILAVVAVAASATSNFIGADPNKLSCDPTGQEFLLLPHFEDCSKYYMCAHGQEVEFSCPAGLIFDFGLQTCNWDWAVECVLRTGGDEEIEGSGEEWAEDEDQDDHSRVQRSVFHVPLINCADAEDAARQVAFKGDCQRYWRCQQGVLTQQYCIDGLFFNEKTQQCDFEANVRCLAETEDELKGEFLVY